MADKNIGRFGTGNLAGVSHLVAVAEQGVSVDTDPVLVPKDEVNKITAKEDTSSVAISGVGSTAQPLKADVKLSPDSGNSLEIRSGGLWADEGAQGLSAYEVALTQGFSGSEQDWLLTLTGPEGPQGIQGPAGAKGDQGEKGDAGDQGAAGATGAAGAQGIQGPKGDKGDKGDQG